MKTIACILFISFSLALRAQAPQSMTSAEMYLALQKLKVLGSVLYIAAHPDDENTRLLAYYSKEKLYRTGYLSITRGDGGQNLIGDEQGIELGLIRTQELLAARRIDGAEQFFTRAFDFGYSKNPEETFKKWNKEKVLADVVWVIRKFQPDVIISRFPTTGEGGHGHHTASAILANEAFDAAADPNKFPEQLKFVRPWQPKRVVWNSFNFNNPTSTREGELRMDVGAYNPLLGKGYGEIAAESRSQHKSQGFGVAAGRGEAFEFFKATRGTQPSTDLFEDIDASWNKIQGGAAIERSINAAIEAFDFRAPEKSVSALVGIYKMINALPSGTIRDKKLNETAELIRQLGGIWIDAYTSQAVAVQGDSLRFTVNMNNRLGVNAKLFKVAVDAFDTTINQVLARNRNVVITKTIAVPANKPVSQPYWLQHPMEEGYYNVTDQMLIGNPDAMPAYLAHFEFDIEGQHFRFVQPVRYKVTDPVRGELYHPLAVIPSFFIKPKKSFVLTTGANTFDGAFTLTPTRINATTQVTASSPNVKINTATFTSPVANENREIPFSVSGSKNETYRLMSNESGINKPGQYINEIKYTHIPNIHYFSPAEIVNKRIDLTIVGKRIGYITGAGDKVPEALEEMGYEVITLGDKELERNNLNQFDAIITGVRAYNTHEWMNKHHQKLMKYVLDGGNLIVQYNTSSQIGPVRAKIGPHPFNISRTRVSQEETPVTITKPDHTVFHYPNKITQQDFDGWIQERSIYHAAQYDSSYQSVLAMNDAGEKPDEGALIIARHGKGTFVYTGIVFFRQLPAGIPGAYRLMANLIALNKQKGF